MLVVQSYALRRIEGFPDLTVISIIFIGFFCVRVDIIVISLIVGAIRGSLSVGTFPVDVLIFPCMALGASWVVNRLNKYNILVQMLITLVAMLVLVSSHVIFLNILYGNNVDMQLILSENKKLFITTIIAAPFVFRLLNTIWKVED